MNPPNYQSKSIRTFIGAKNYQESKAFYQELGFEALEIGDKMTYFKVNEILGFYLQDYYVKDWAENSMIFLEVDNVDKVWADLNARDLHNKYEFVRLTSIKEYDWGRECFIHDPTGILWHFGEFKDKQRGE